MIACPFCIMLAGMERKDLKKDKLPDTPGVYFFRGARRKILYIGKATSLRDRVRSYFSNDLLETRGPRLVKVINDTKSVDYIETDSVLEALILEANLIKRHQPEGNSLSKDDKSFNYILITKEEFPRVLSVRGKDLESRLKETEAKHLFGPFPHGLQFKAAMKIIRKLFPYFDTKHPVGSSMSASQRKRLVFNQQIGVYPGEANKELNKKEYQRTIRHLALFLSGKKGQLLKKLESEMKSYAKHEEFEKADKIKRQIFALNHIQDVSLIKDEFKIPGAGITFRIEAYDVAHTSGREVVGVMTVVEDGEAKKSDYRKFKIKEDANNDVASLREILLRRFGHSEWPMPRLLVVDGGLAQVNAAKRVLEGLGYGIAIVGVTKDERHRVKKIIGDRAYVALCESEILLANSEAHRFAISYHRKRRNF